MKMTEGTLNSKKSQFTEKNEREKKISPPQTIFNYRNSIKYSYLN